jgi:hypothetical protein
VTTPEQVLARRRPRIFSDDTERHLPTVLVPTPRWIWVGVGLMAICMVSYIIVSIGTSSIWLPLQ